MNPNIVDFLIQTVAAVIGGVILFLFGLAYSVISKQTKKYLDWISKIWQVVIALLIFIYITFYIYSTTNSIYISALPLLFALAIYLLIININNSTEEKTAKIFTFQKDLFLSLRVDTILAEIRYWEMRDISENVLSYCYQALTIAPSDYHNYLLILDIIEDTINKNNKRNESISRYRMNELQELLTRVPENHAAQAKRILNLINS